MEQLTVKEALDQGYQHYCFNKDGYQSLRDISDVDEDDLKRDDICIVNKEPENIGGISCDELKDLIGEHLQCQFDDLTGDDTNSVYEAIKEVDFTDTENKITGPIT